MLNEENKTNYYVRAIIKFFLDHEMATTNQLVDEVGLSEKTIRTKIDSINVLLSENDLGQIRKKPRIGMWLDSDDHQRAQIMILISSNTNELMQNDVPRMIIALKQILKISDKHTITTKQLADILYLSVPTTLKVVNDCKQWLSMFNIDLKIIRNKGFKLQCEEMSYRFALKEFMMKLDTSNDISQNILTFMPGLQLETIRKDLIDTEKEWNFTMTEESYNEILIYLSISIYRCMRGEKYALNLSLEDTSSIAQYSEHQLVLSLYKRIEESFGIKIPESDISFLTIQILCSRIIDQNYGANTKDILREYDLKLDTFVSKVINIVSSVMNVDLSNDDALHRGLLIHLKPIIFRMRYKIVQMNELKGYIKNEFNQIMRVSWIISIIFEEYFNMQITEDELSYIALYIQSALDRNSKPVKAVLVSVSSMGINQLICDKIKRSCNEVEITKVVSYHDFRLQDCDGIELVITTKKLNKEDDRVVEINEFFFEEFAKKIQSKIQYVQNKRNSQIVRFDPVCHQYFEPDLMFTGLKITNKKSLLSFLCQKLEKKGYVTFNYYNTVLARENATPTSVGNGVAIPHGAQQEINEAKIVIATLERPILWDTEWVDVVFLLVVKMTNDYEVNRTQLFYKQYIKLVESDEKINVLRQFKSSIDLYRYLVQ